MANGGGWWKSFTPRSSGVVQIQGGRTNGRFAQKANCCGHLDSARMAPENPMIPRCSLDGFMLAKGCGAVRGRGPMGPIWYYQFF